VLNFVARVCLRIAKDILYPILGNSD